MSREITLTIPEDLYQQVEQVAVSEDKNIADLFLEAVKQRYPSFPAHPEREQMQKEIDAFCAMHTQLLADYKGQYVAIHKGKLVDHDADPIKLHHRVLANFPNQIVLSRKVELEPDRVLHIRSPRLEPLA